MKIPTEIVPCVAPSDLSRQSIAAEFRQLVADGTKFKVAGKGKSQFQKLGKRFLVPRFKIELFGTRCYLSDVLQIPELRFYLAYVVQATEAGRLTIFPRIFYKDLSLAWRSASHFAYEDDGDLWIGKGDVSYDLEDGVVMAESMEATTNLPIEMQSGLEEIIGLSKAKNVSAEVLKWTLRQGPSSRVEPYDDFTAPRERAAANPKNLIHRGNSIAKFKKHLDPSSLVVASGFEPDFKNGVIGRSSSHSKLYGGRLERFRILSTNQKIQYYFIAGRRHVWIIPPQATTTQLSSYAVRTIDALADDDLCIPGWEYHHDVETENGTEIYSQIPAGFAGEACPFDDDKADASAWLEKIPMIQEFRKQVLMQKG